jgi:hypothetical protein
VAGCDSLWLGKRDDGVYKDMPENSVSSNNIFYYN